MTNKPYLAYLLRLWKSGDLQESGWRASLEESHTRQITGFNSVEALNDYLIQLAQKLDDVPVQASSLSSHDIKKKESDREAKK